MLNAPLLLETGLLLLAAFIVGAIVGTLARLVLAPRRRAAAPAAAAAAVASPVPPAADLVTAPEIRPIARPTVADRIAAAAEGKSAAIPVAPELPVVPAALPPEATIAAPLAPVPAAEPEAEPLRETGPLPVEQRDEPTLAPDDLVVTDAPQDLPAILEDTHARPEAAQAPAVIAEAPLVEPEAEREAAMADESLLDRADDEARLLADLEAERSAMQAIESGWTPRPAARVTSALLEIAGAPAAPATGGAVEAEAPAAEPEVAAVGRTSRTGGFGRPPALDAPRDGVRDDLSQIRGITPAIASALNGLGIYHLDQVAAWDQKAVVWLENHFGFKGRIGRERWQQQARDLAKGRPAPARTTAVRPVRR